MSSLWTPGGEVPVGPDRGRAPTPPPASPADDQTDLAPPPASDLDEAELRARVEAFQRQLLAAPVEDVVVEHAIGLYELAALHLSQPSVRAEAARLAIDAFAALVEHLPGRLGPAEAELRSLVHQLRLAYVQVTSQAGPPGTEAEGEPGR